MRVIFCASSAARRNARPTPATPLAPCGTNEGRLRANLLVWELHVLYRQPKMTRLLCVLMLYRASWVWMQAERGEMHDGPVLFTLKDRIGLAVGVLVVITVLLAN